MEKDLQAKIKPHFYRKPEKILQDKTWSRKVKFLFQNKIISGTNCGLKISLPWAKSVLVLSATGTCSLGFEAAREHATHNQSILPLVPAKLYVAWSILVPHIRCCQKPQSSH